MIPKSLRWRLPLSYAGIALLATVSLGAVLLLLLQQVYRQQEQDYLIGNAQTISEQVAPILQNGELDQLPAQVKGLSFLSQTRIKLFDASRSTQLADSGDPQLADANSVIAISVEVDGVEQVFSQSNQGDGSQTSSKSTIIVEQGLFTQEESIIVGTDGEEITTIETDGIVRFDQEVDIEESNGRLPVNSTQFGFGLGETAVSEERSNLSVSTTIIDNNNQIIGYVSLSEGPAFGRQILQTVFWGWVIASLIAVFVAGSAGWLTSKRLTQPLQTLTRVSQRMASGDLTARATQELDAPRRDELGELATSFDQMATQVEETIVTLRQFVADAAHELHTPLTALQTDLALLEQSNEDQVTATRLTRAMSQAKRLQTLTDSLLDLSRLEADNTLPLTAVSLSDVVRSVGDLFASQAEQAHIAYTVSVPDAPLEILGNYGRLHQAFSNLIDNALKFTPVHGTVSLSVATQGGDAVVTIADSGIGIPAEDLPFLYGRFHRGRNTQTYPGSGLGLAIVRAIVEGCNGRIAVESDPSGTQFFVSFPLK